MTEKITNEALNRLDPQAYKLARKLPVHVVLDNIRSAQNVGSVFRSMDSFRCKRMHLCGITAQPPNREINKTALGATHTVEWEYGKDTLETVKKLQSEGVAVYAVEQVEGAIDLKNFAWPSNEEIAVVFGNEVDGISEAVVQHVDGHIEIAQFGTKHSLNIAVCTGIVLWHLSRGFDYSTS